MWRPQDLSTSVMQKQTKKKSIFFLSSLSLFHNLCLCLCMCACVSFFTVCKCFPFLTIIFLNGSVFMWVHGSAERDSQLLNAAADISHPGYADWIHPRYQRQKPRKSERAIVLVRNKLSMNRGKCDPLCTPLDLKDSLPTFSFSCSFVYSCVAAILSSQCVCFFAFFFTCDVLQLGDYSLQGCW